MKSRLESDINIKLFYSTWNKLDPTSVIDFYFHHNLLQSTPITISNGYYDQLSISNQKSHC